MKHCLDDIKALSARHGDQKWGEFPYAVHLENVARVAYAIDPSIIIQKIAYAHDLLEDTDVLPEELDEDIRNTVVLLSRNYSQRGKTYFQYVTWLSTLSDKNAQKVKISDSIVNLALSRRTGSSLASRYLRSIQVLWKSVFDEPFDPERMDELASMVQFEQVS